MLAKTLLFPFLAVLALMAAPVQAVETADFQSLPLNQVLQELLMKSGGFIPSVDYQTPPGDSLEQYRCYLRLLDEYTR